MSRKTKLVLMVLGNGFKVVKTVNTISYGFPGTLLSLSDFNEIFDTNSDRIDNGDLTIEIIKFKPHEVFT